MSKQNEYTLNAVDEAMLINTEVHNIARFIACHNGEWPFGISNRAYTRIVNDTAWFNRLIRQEQRAYQAQPDLEQNELPFDDSEEQSTHTQPY